jgi:uncharacterized protein GlcG (DUF336 family)
MTLPPRRPGGRAGARQGAASPRHGQAAGAARLGKRGRLGYKELATRRPPAAKRRHRQEKGKPMSTLTLDQAQAILAAARQRRAALREVPLAYAVVDSGGHLIVAAREDGAGFLRTEIAINKAWTCFAMGMPLRTLRDRTRDFALFFASIQGAAEGRIMHALGGVIIRDAAGTALGAMGISGAAGEVDEAICVHAIEAAGLKAEIGGAGKT